PTMAPSEFPKTLGELKESGYQVLPIREEMRKNLIARLRSDEPMFEDVMGYEETVIPQIENAILSGQDIILDRKSTRLNSSHVKISYAVFCLKKKKKNN